MKENILLKTVCTFGIGGPARYFQLVRNLEDLKSALEFAESQKLKPFIFGGGSNLLFPDEGLDTVVIKIISNNIQLSDDKTYLQCDAGVSWIQIARYCSQNSLYGIEPLYGLPGTVGGAIYGNAGCHGLETADILIEATVYNTDIQEISTVTQAEFNFVYRKSGLKDTSNLIVLNAKFKISTNPAKSKGNPADHAEERKEKQPTGLTTGSFFKNPPANFAGKLIEEAGLKGYAINDIKVSEKHANFFINTGSATAKDVLKLKQYIQDTVFKKFGIKLEPEVKIIESQDW
jgi:UDP-N-acetylmuramate dehydrogenase